MPNIAVATSTGWNILTYASNIFGGFSPFFIFIIGIILGFFVLEFLVDLIVGIITSRREEREIRAAVEILREAGYIVYEKPPLPAKIIKQKEATETLKRYGFVITPPKK